MLTTWRILAAAAGSRLPADGGLSGQRGDHHLPRQGTKSHAGHGLAGDLPETPHNAPMESIAALFILG
jgi:hypothetical protein